MRLNHILNIFSPQNPIFNILLYNKHHNAKTYDRMLGNFIEKGVDLGNEFLL